MPAAPMSREKRRGQCGDVDSQVDHLFPGPSRTGFHLELVEPALDGHHQRAYERSAYAGPVIDAVDDVTTVLGEKLRSRNRASLVGRLLCTRASEDPDQIG